MTTIQDRTVHRTGTSVRRHPSRQRLVTVLAATAVGLLLWAVADPVAGIDLTVADGVGSRTVGPGWIALGGLVPGAAAVALAVLCERRTGHPRRWWLTVAGVTLLVSLAGPSGATDAGAGLVLAAMHVAVGATLITGIGATLTRAAGGRG